MEDELRQVLGPRAGVPKPLLTMWSRAALCHTRVTDQEEKKEVDPVPCAES